MSEFIGELIVRAIPVAFPAFLLIALLVHWGVLPDGTEPKTKKEPKDEGKKADKKEEKPSPSKDEGGEK